MSLLHESHDSLPYIDRAPSPPSLTTAQALVDAEIAAHANTDAATPVPLHPSLPTYPPPRFSNPVQSALQYLDENNLEASQQQHLPPGIDLSRYEDLELPTPDSDPELFSSDGQSKNEQVLLEAYGATLQKSATSLEYLHARHLNLNLLQRYGANAYLISNHYLEAMLREVEGELARCREEVEGVEGRRRGVQEGRKGEAEGLEEGWRKGVGRMLEVEAAAEGLKEEILRRRREGAVVGASEA
ncbi:hypothetical protein EV356DRAFT_515228 [Viridothelium virens]|uniref:Breast carcinoma amplified sequence 2 n=1 Tax=Viridothelium virens TaxID=1048519 RepID=A0A6A6H8J8_VIRVR|nr:hypothetical protein EV356DRAFT_515228 [Viridothelium virens]